MKKLSTFSLDRLEPGRRARRGIDLRDLPFASIPAALFAHSEKKGEVSSGLGEFQKRLTLRVGRFFMGKKFFLPFLWIDLSGQAQYSLGRRLGLGWRPNFL